MSAQPPGTPANDERARPSQPPAGGAAPSSNPNAPVVPTRPPEPAMPPLSGRPPPPRPQPTVSWHAPPAPPSPTAPLPTPAYGDPGQQPSGTPGPPPTYGGYSPPPYGGTQPLPQQGARPTSGDPHSPPLYTDGYGAPPPSYYPPAAPPPKGKGGLILGIGAAALALIAIVAGLFFVSRRNVVVTATATPTRAAVASATVATAVTAASPTSAGIGNLPATLAAAATGTAVAGPSATPRAPTVAATPSGVVPRASATVIRTASAAPRTATASRPAASGTPASVGAFGTSAAGSAVARSGTAPAGSAVALGETWTDPDGRLALQYPTGWTVTQQEGSQSNIVEFDSPDGTSFFVDVFRAAGTPMAEIQNVRNNRAKSTQFSFAFSPITDATIGGEAAKTISYNAKRQGQASSAGIDGALWVVNHAGTEYDFEVIATGSHRGDIEAILATVVFT